MRKIYTHDEAHFLVGNFVKVYPNNKIKVFAYSKPFYKRKEDFEMFDPPVLSTTQERSSEASTKGSSEERSLRRTKTLISDIVLCTDFDMFATFTFSEDRQDIQKCKRKMSDWLKSQQKLHGKFKYLIVPELHKDQKSLHFHALLKNYTGKIKDSGKKINNRKAYNITSYKKGFSSVIKIDNIEKVSSYVKKYITKDMPKIGKSNKKFWNSKGLQRPQIMYNIHLEEYELKKVYEQEFFTISTGVLHSNSQLK